MQTLRLNWQDEEKNLAPLSEAQLDILYEISNSINDQFSSKTNKNEGNNIILADAGSNMHAEFDKIETSRDFFKWYAKIEEELESENSIHSRECLEKLSFQKTSLSDLVNEASSALDDMTKITTSYLDISAKTTLLNEMSEQLYVDQSKLQKISAEINEKLHYFTCVNHLSQVLSLSSLSVSSSNFFESLEKLDECTEYMRTNSNFKESYPYLLKYKQTLYNVMSMIRTYVKQIFVNATEAAMTPFGNNSLPQLNSVVSSDLAFSLYYGKFQTNATKLKPIIEQIENRATNNLEYAQLLEECKESYLTQRLYLMNNAIADAVTELVNVHRGDNTALFRNGCTFMLHVCQDEMQLYHHFFKEAGPQLIAYHEKLCIHLYDNLRPLIVHINHLETLAELCSIIRAEMAILDIEQINDAYTKVLWQLLQDVQERFVFRTHVFFQTDLLNYRPSAGDLAYPEKLQMMESIALSQTEENFKSRTGSSPADLHGMWYPTVKRTLVCLSRLYRCVDRPIFQGLSQEALTICVATIVKASSMISTNKTVIDGELFQIKHLLILREQIAPFQVDFTVKEMSLDFSKMKTAAFSLLHKRKQLFSLNANNALLEFLLEGTPQVKEQLLDSRKEVDKQLKHSCEKFIKHCTDMFINPINPFIEKNGSDNENRDGKSKPDPEVIGVAVRAVQNNVKTHLSAIQKSMQLYLANKETEFILFKLIRNNVMTAFTQLEQMLVSEEYTSEQLLVIACPTAEQISVILSSASLVTSLDDSDSINSRSISQASNA